MSKAWEKHGCGSLGEVGGGRGWGCVCEGHEGVCVPGVFAMQSSVWSSGLLGTPAVCVQLDLQDVFIREAIPSCTMRTHTHTHRCLQALALTAQGYVVSAPCVTAQYVRYAERRSVSVQRRGLSCSLCLMSASWQPGLYAFSPLLSVCQKACSKIWRFGLPRQASEGPPLTRFPQAAAGGGGGGLTLAASFV